MICDAVFSDFDNDGWTDLVVAGEWLPVTFLKNNNGVFKNVNAGSGIDKQIGWWNTIAPGDFDNDGDIDYVVGNAGENTFYKASENRPVSIYAKDFDNNGSYDAIPSVYIPSTMTDTTVKEFPAFGRDDLIKQMISMRSKFQSYNAYALATMDSMFTKEQLKDAVIYRANQLKSCFVRNDGSGKFSISPLPIQAQLSMLCGIVADDINGDGNLDLTINGNDYSTEVGTGRYDALNGLVMLGDGKGGFRATTVLEGGLFIPGNGKALVKIRGSKGDMIFAASENRGPLRMFSLKQNMTRSITILPGDVYVEVQYKNGKKQKQECYYGNSYMSQSARFITVGPDVQSVTITDQQGNKRPGNVDTIKK